MIRSGLEIIEIALPLFFIFLLSNGCGKPISGCLDIRAVNFKADADETCCCEFPVFTLRVNHLVNGNVHHPDTVYYNDLGHPYRMLQANIILSDFSLHFKDGPAAKIIDTFLLARTDNSQQYIRADQVLITREAAVLKVGSFIRDGVLDSVTCRIGLNDDLSDLKPSDFPVTHPLHSNRDSLYSETEGRASFNVEWLQSVTSERYIWKAPATAYVTLITEKSVDLAQPIELILNIHYDKWFAGQNLTGASPMPDISWPDQVLNSISE